VSPKTKPGLERRELHMSPVTVGQPMNNW